MHQQIEVSRTIYANFLDDLLHPLRDPKLDHDPGRPFTPPPPGPGADEDDDDDGPSFPMDPALA